MFTFSSFKQFFACDETIPHRLKYHGVHSTFCLFQTSWNITSLHGWSQKVQSKEEVFSSRAVRSCWRLWRPGARVWRTELSKHMVSAATVSCPECCTNRPMGTSFKKSLYCFLMFFPPVSLLTKKVLPKIMTWEWGTTRNFLFQYQGETKNIHH